MDPCYDTRDAVEHAAVRAILAELPADHPAQLAYREHATTIALTHLVADRHKLVESLKGAFLEGYRRMWDRVGGHFRP